MQTPPDWERTDYQCSINYKADGDYRYFEMPPEKALPLGANFGKWKPSIHMPKWASRIQLRVTDVRVEQLQEISEEDVEREGVKIHVPVPGDGLPQPKLQFKRLWDAINAKSGFGWDTNPFVWVVKFKRM